MYIAFHLEVKVENPDSKLHHREMFMATARRFRKLITGRNLRAKTVLLALTFVFVLTAATTDAAHAQSFQVLFTFNGGPDGAQPYAGVTVDRAGNLYGATHSGNAGTNWGNVYKLQRFNSGWVYKVLFTFDGTLLSRPVFGPDGTLYGTSPNNLAGYYYGYIYNLRPPVAAFCHATTCPWDPTILYHFAGGADGNSPRYGDVIFDHAGNMYGTTAIGGNGNGVVFEMTHSGNTWTEQPIYTFSGPDGAKPYSGAIFDNAGNLYGTTTQGGAFGHGAVYELSPSGGGWTEQVLYSFQNANDGSFPTGGLVFDQSGNLYGSTNAGGSGGGGTIFELTPAGGGWTYNLLYSFTGGTGCGPWGTLSMNGGTLFGTTVCDGAHNAGNVFKLTNSGGSWTYGSIYDFTGGNDGKAPYCNVNFDAAGNMFGTAFQGGAFNQGVIWEITP